MTVKNLDYIRGLHSAEFPDLGVKIAEALQSIANQATNSEQQGNTNPTGQPAAPPAINSLVVSAQNGHFQVAITDNSQIYRGISYYVEHADNPNFTNPSVEHLGPARNANLFLGNVARYWRAYSAYASSPPSPAVYHGNSGKPIAVTGGGSVGGPAFLPSQGSGTGAAGVGVSGPGPIPFRSATGIPPVR